MICLDFRIEGIRYKGRTPGKGDEVVEQEWRERKKKKNKNDFHFFSETGPLESENKQSVRASFPCIVYASSTLLLSRLPMIMESINIYLDDEIRAN